jgi:hypothetical protein
MLIYSYIRCTPEAEKKDTIYTIPNQQIVGTGLQPNVRRPFLGTDLGMDLHPHHLHH